MALTTEEMYKNIRGNKSKFYIKLLLFIAIIVILSIIGSLFIFSGEKIVEYNTINPEIGDIESTISASGTINATNEVKIGSQISGTISDVFVEENDRVVKGDVLAIINPETIKQTIARNEAQLYSAKAALKSSEAALSNKKWNYERLKKLFVATSGKSPSESELESARMDYETSLAEVDVRKATIKEAETNLNSSKIDLKNSIIVSPVNGVVLVRSVDAGQTVAASFSTPELFTVAENLEKMKLVVKVSEADVGRVNEGQIVKFTVDAYPDEHFESVVNRVNIGASASDDNIVSYETTIYIDNNEYLLRSGMSATADIVTASAKDAMLVPVGALYFNPYAVVAPKKKDSFFGPPPMFRRRQQVTETYREKDKGSLWILNNGVPEKIDVNLGVSDGKFVQVTSGNISKDTQVIIGIKPSK